MSIIILPSHLHTDPSGTKEQVKSHPVILPPKPKFHTVLTLTPGIGLIYSVFLALRAVLCNRLIRSQLPYNPNSACDNVECATISKKAWGDFLTALLGGTGFLIISIVVCVIFASIYKVLKEFCTLFCCI